MSSIYLTFKQYKLLEEFYKGKIARFFESGKIYVKDRWAFIEQFENRTYPIDGKSLAKLIKDSYVEIYDDDGYKKMKITGKGKSLVLNNRRIYRKNGD